MKMTVARLVLPLVFAAALIAPSLLTAPSAGAVPPSISSVRTDGHTVVWLYDYYMSTVNVRTVGETSIRTLAQNVSYPDVSGDRVVWEADNSGKASLGGVHLSDGSPLELPSAPGQQMKPSLSGDRLVWVNQDSGTSPATWTIMTADLSSSATAQVVATLPSDMTEVGRPEISGNRVVWSLQYVSQGSSEARWELWTASFSGSTVKIASGSGAANNLLGYDVGGNDVVYANSGDIHLLSLDVPKSNLIIGSGLFPTTDGRYVFWSAQPVNTRANIDAYDALTHSRFAAVANEEVNNLPWASNGVLAWLSGMPYSENLVVRDSQFVQLLPTAPRPNPGTTNPNWTYFPTTGHFLAFGFNNFWVNSGGLPVFGYALTEEFTQNGFTVQYLERQRFEYHPEFAGTPYETELGLLGSEAATATGLVGTAPFTALPANTTSDSNCVSEAATRHRICGAFKQYWQSHGLDFGDSGVSYRESLALFGYPISDEFTDSSTGLTVQYFERAVFEYHPNNPDPYNVELRLLGSQRLQSFDW